MRVVATLFVLALWGCGSETAEPSPYEQARTYRAEALTAFTARFPSGVNVDSLAHDVLPIDLEDLTSASGGVLFARPYLNSVSRADAGFSVWGHDWERRYVLRADSTTAYAARVQDPLAWAVAVDSVRGRWVSEAVPVGPEEADLGVEMEPVVYGRLLGVLPRPE